MATVKSKKKMTKKQLLDKLKSCLEYYDIEKSHSDADEALLNFINDPEITKAYNKLEKWYA